MLVKITTPLAKRGRGKNRSKAGLGRSRPTRRIPTRRRRKDPGKVPRGQTGSPRSSSHKAPPATGASHKAFANWLSHLVFPFSSSVEGTLGKWSRLGAHRHGGSTKRRGGKQCGKRRREAAGVRARGEAPRTEAAGTWARPSRPPRCCPGSVGVGAPSGERPSHAPDSGAPHPPKKTRFFPAGYPLPAPSFSLATSKKTKDRGPSLGAYPP